MLTVFLILHIRNIITTESVKIATELQQLSKHSQFANINSNPENLSQNVCIKNDLLKFLISNTLFTNSQYKH